MYNDDNEKSRGKILIAAKRIINGDRQDAYGDPEDSFGTISQFWSTYLDRHISSKDVAIMMGLLKIARMKGQVEKIDNYVDAAGYIGLAGDMVKG